MAFKEKYKITTQYLTTGTKRRSGKLIAPSVKFVVAHDTGNPNSTAVGNIKYYENTKDVDYASAHIFVDDKNIIECISAVVSDKPEKAWHVIYDKPKDNELFGFDANDAAIGVEYCYGNNINADEAYRRYLWVIAYICHKFGLDPAVSITGHCILDPGRKTDPKTGLAHSNRTYEHLLKDIVSEYNECTKEEAPQPKPVDVVNVLEKQENPQNIKIETETVKPEANPPPTPEAPFSNKGIPIFLNFILNLIKSWKK